MDTGKINTVLVIITIGIILTVEIGIQKLPLEPLMKTGTARCLEIVLILMVFRWFDNGLGAIGLSCDRIVPGIKKGLIWSGGFGILAAMLGALLFFSGINPFKLLRVVLPASKLDIVLFYIIGGLMAPLAEEIFFRGVIYGYIKKLLYKKINKWSIPAALIISTYLFVMAHQGSSGIPLLQLVGGIVFCVSYEIEKSLLTPILIHSLGNLALFTISSGNF
ncbi:MAG: CPBP family intramembrane metalloprotease [Desulfobacteraceae bacterium]|nr:CPBP family intramembrane metalloprotease [Desulfobacteraceae bacterium]MBC2755775.1 CPBP family intramembrane metalloprotease [Desulfobacteraceae bacterium]